MFKFALICIFFPLLLLYYLFLAFVLACSFCRKMGAILFPQPVHQAKYINLTEYLMSSGTCQWFARKTEPKANRLWTKRKTKRWIQEPHTPSLILNLCSNIFLMVFYLHLFLHGHDLFSFRVEICFQYFCKNIVKLKICIESNEPAF